MNVWNDHPAIETLIEGARGEITDALSKAGYQLLTLKTKPFPDRTAPAEAETAQTSTAPGDAAGKLPDAASYASKPYRGVDYRA